MPESGWARYGSMSQADYEARRADEILMEAACAACELCDAEGYRGTQVCDHIDRTEIARRGVQACREALAKGAQ